MRQTIPNPILPGFHPDVSALQVGGDYYIATSTFECWPGIDIYHSTDLVHWEWIAAPLQNAEQVPSHLEGNYNSGKPVGPAPLLCGRAVLAGVHRREKLHRLQGYPELRHHGPGHHRPVERADFRHRQRF